MLTADAARSRKPAAGSPAYTVLAAAADAAPRDSHFDLGLDALLHGLATPDP